MAIEYRCEKCGKLLRVADQYGGKMAKCPDCGQQGQIPMPGASSAPMATPPSSNPYSSPAASGTTTGAAGGVTIDIADIFKRTWAIFKSQIGLCILLAFVASLVPGGVIVLTYIAAAVIAMATKSGFLASLIMFAGYLGMLVSLAAVMAGLLRCFLKIARGQPTAIGELFAFGPELVPFIGIYLLFSLIVGVGSLCVIPGLILGALFSQSVFLVLDRKVAVIDSLSQSKDLTMSNLWMLVILYLLASVAWSLVAGCTCGIGSLVATPFLLLMAVVVHLRLTGQAMVEPV